MSYSLLRDQRGASMLFELVLVSLVLALVGAALYQSNHQKPTAAVVQPQITTAQGAAEAATSLAQRDAADDISLSASADDAADELSAASNDALDLGGSFDENNF